MYDICFLFFWMRIRCANLTHLLLCADEAFQSVNSELKELPAVELSTLPLILKVSAEPQMYLLSFFLPYVFSFIGEE